MKSIIESKTPAWLGGAAELKEKVLTRFAETPEALRQKAPSVDAWSAAEVVEHLIIVEEQVAGPWRVALGSNPPPVPGLKSAALAAMVSAVMGGTNVRVPTVPGLVPSGGLALTELTARWAKARDGLAAALPESSKVTWIMHPVFGPLSSDQMGKLLVAHLKHHLRHWPDVKPNN